MSKGTCVAGDFSPLFEYIDKCRILRKYYNGQQISKEEFEIINNFSDDFKIELMKSFDFWDYIDKQYKFKDPISKKDYQKLAKRENQVKIISKQLQTHLLAEETRKKAINVINDLLLENIKKKIRTIRSNYQIDKGNIVDKVRKDNDELIKICQEYNLTFYKEYKNYDEYTKNMLLGYAMFCWYESEPLDFEQAILIANTSNQEKIAAMNFFAFSEKYHYQNNHHKTLIRNN